MDVCLCERVSERQVRRAIRRGAHDVAAVGEKCGAGTDCGSCRKRIRDLIEEEAARSLAA